MKKRRLRPTLEDGLRAGSYFAVMAWAVLFLVFPPVSYANELDIATRIFWLAICFLGALTAFLGAVLRWDLKVELPGLVFMGIGPLFYSAAQIYYVFNPLPTFEASSRFHLAVYALLPLLMTLPRMYSLYAESRRMKNINEMRAEPLTPEQESQPGAFTITRVEEEK